MNKKQKKRECGSLGRYFAVFIIPALAIYLIFSILPFMYTIFYSFTDYTDMNPTNLHFVAFQNYIKVFQTPLMRIAIKNSLIYAILLTGFQVILGLPIAAVLNKKLKTRNLLRAVYFFPAVFSSLIIGYLWNFILSSSDYGLINNLLHRFGLDTINFFTTNRALFSVIFTQIWQWTGWAMVIFLANLQSIAPELYEAAQIDGANGRQSFFRITLPLMCPSVKIIVVTGLIGGMKAFDAIYSMTSGGPGNATETVMTVMMKKGISDGFYYHPLFIMRHRMSKQADAILGMYLHNDLFTEEEIRRNYDFYQEVTLHHSSLSTCIFGIVACDIGYLDEAYKYFSQSARMDLDDYHNNFYAGIHAANMAGTWQAIVNGFAGVRCQNGVLKFKPTIPKEWEEYAFRLKFKGALLEVRITKDEVEFTLLEGGEISFTVRGKEVVLKSGETYTYQLNDSMSYRK